jgi:hypothetical protein
VLLVLIHLAHPPDNPGPGGAVSHQPIDGRPDHPSPGPGAGPNARPDLTRIAGAWIIDGTLIPVHDQSITAVSKNYHRSVNTQIIICCQTRRCVAVGRCWPGNRNDIVVARHTVTQRLDGRVVLGDGGNRGITSIITPRRDHTGRSSATTATGRTATTGPGSTTSPPDPRTGRYCANAAAVTTRSTTTFR